MTSHWDDSWCQSIEMFMHDYQFLPPIPDQYVAPFLNDPQKAIWRSTQKFNGFWGGFGMMGGIMVDDPLEDDELRVAREEAAKNDPKPEPNQPGMHDARGRADAGGPMVTKAARCRPRRKERKTLPNDPEREGRAETVDAPRSPAEPGETSVRSIEEIDMTDRNRPIGRLLTAAVLLAIVGAGTSARAQDDEEEDEVRPRRRSTG